MIKSIFLHIAFVLQIITAFGQVYKFENISTIDGVSNNSITAIEKDRTGFIWFGSYHGLNRFDGSQIYTYYNEQNNKNSISDNYITCLFKDASGRLWIGTRNGGLNFYRDDFDDFEKFPLTDQESNSIEIRAIVEDKANNLWIGTINNGLFKISKDRSIIKKYATSSKEITLVSNNITALAYNHKTAQLIIGSKSSHIEFIDTNNNHYKKLNVTEPLNPIYPKTILLDKHDNIWIASYKKGLFKVDGTSQKISNWTTINSGLSNNILFHAQYNSITNEIWLATDGSGIQLYSIEQNTFYEIKKTLDPKSLTSNSILFIFEDFNGSKWIGTQYGGINFYNILKSQYNGLNIFDGLPDNRVKCLLDYNESILFIGTDGGGIASYNKENGAISSIELPFYKDLHVNKLYKASNNTLLIGSYGSGILKYNPVSKSVKRILPENFTDNNSKDIFIQDLIEINGTIWFGTPYGLYYLMPNKENVVNVFLFNEKTKQDYTQLNSIMCLFAEQDILWVGTKAGIAVVDLNNRKPIKYLKTKMDSGPTPLDENIIHKIKRHQGELFICTADGLKILNSNEPKIESYFPEHITNTISVFDITLLNDVLWICSNNGLDIYLPSNKISYHLNYNYGLQSNNLNCILSTQQGELFIGSNKGINHFYPKNIKQIPAAPRLIFTDLKLFNKSVTFSSDNTIIDKHISTYSSLKLRHNQNDVGFAFVAIDYNLTSNINYFYKLENYDKEWNSNGNEHEANYTNLPHGNYTLKVKAKDSNNLWESDELQLALVILPPWHKTTWALIGYVLLFFLLLYIFSKILIKWTTLNHKLEIETIEKQQTERINKERIEFFTNISHEFKTPLSLILAPIDMVIETGQGTKEDFSLIKQNAQRLLRLINQLMDFRKNENERLQLYSKEFEVNHFFESIMASFQGLAKQKRISLSYKPIENTIIEADEDKLDKVVFNLLSNAFKACKQGDSIKVSAKVHKRKDKQYLTFKVTDTGKGISAEHLNKIFERFYQIENKSGGTGVGLSLTKAYINIMKGLIDVKSELGLGTRFKISIPVKVLGLSELTNKTPEIEIIDLPSENLEPLNNTMAKKVLIVDDEIDILNYLETVLSRHYTVIKAQNGKKGFKKVLSQWPDLVISDVMMPIESGFDLCKNIKSDERTNHIPVILLTAMSSDENVLKGTKLGADLYVPKPFNINLLISQITTLFTNINKRQEYYNLLGHNANNGSKTIQKENPFVLKARETILNHIMEANFDAEAFSEAMAMHRSNLHHKLKTLTGLTTTEFMRRVKLEEAIQYLHNDDLTVGEIAYKVGFNSPSYFSKCFKKVYGNYPKEHINKITSPVKNK